MTENADVVGRISSTIRLAKNLLALVDKAKDNKVGKSNNSSNNKTVKRLPLSKKPNVLIEYFISFYFKKDEFLLIVLAIIKGFN